MRIYDMTVQFTLVKLGEAIALNRPELAVEYMAGAFDDYPLQEQIWIIALDRKNHPLCRHRLSIGTLTSTCVHPREIFRALLLTPGGVASYFLIHQHPSGVSSPSQADITMTRTVREASKIMDVPLMDHLVIGFREADPTGRGFYSMREAGLL